MAVGLMRLFKAVEITINNLQFQLLIKSTVETISNFSRIGNGNNLLVNSVANPSKSTRNFECHFNANDLQGLCEKKNFPKRWLELNKNSNKFPDSHKKGFPLAFPRRQ